MERAIGADNDVRGGEEARIEMSHIQVSPTSPEPNERDTLINADTDTTRTRSGSTSKRASLLSPFLFFTRLLPSQLTLWLFNFIARLHPFCLGAVHLWARSVTCGAEMEMDEDDKSERPIDETPTEKFILRRKCDTPSYLHNPHILTGYRVCFTPSLAARSLFRWHNETVNVWTHLVPLLWFCYKAYHALLIDLPLYSPTDPARAGIDSPRNDAGELILVSGWDYCMFLVFYGSALACFFWSSLYHLMGCCTYDSHAKLYRCDIMGILSLIGGSYIPAIYYYFQCQPQWRTLYCTIISTLLLLLVFSFQCPACQSRRFHSLRVAGLVTTVGFSIVPAFHWIVFLHGRTFPSIALSTFLLPLCSMLGWYLLGFVFYSQRIPERFAPGTFDFIFQSHNFWHCFVFLATYVWEGEVWAAFRRKGMTECNEG